jgi:putative heme-binding domain-containing protein
MVAGRGGRLGPDLTRIGARRSPASLKESVINPSASISDGYLGIQIVPRRGPTIFGTVKNEDDFTIQIFDTTENFRSFRKADLAQVKILDRSLMPRPALTPTEVDDIVAYLSRLREGE